jgi:hypothetical protein
MTRTLTAFQQEAVFVLHIAGDEAEHSLAEIDRHVAGVAVGIVDELVQDEFGILADLDAGLVEERQGGVRRVAGDHRFVAVDGQIEEQLPMLAIEPFADSAGIVALQDSADLQIASAVGLAGNAPGDKRDCAGRPRTPMANSNRQEFAR